MFRQTYQSGLLSILSSQGSKPLQTWNCRVSNGYIKRITDEDTKSLVLELISNNVSSTFITCPACSYDTLGIKMQYLNLYIKNLRRYFVMEIEVLDSDQMHRRFKISTFAMKTKIGPFGTHSPLNWVEGWNRLALNLESFTKTVYGTNYVECRRITIHANCRIRRVFFADREYKEEELPMDYQIRCRLDQIKRRESLRRRTSPIKKSTSQVKTDRNLPVNIEKRPTPERLINTPQGSVVSDLPQSDHLSEQEVERPEPAIIDEMSQLQLDVNSEKALDEENLSNNAYQRFFELFRR